MNDKISFEKNQKERKDINERVGRETHQREPQVIRHRREKNVSRGQENTCSSSALKFLNFEIIMFSFTKM